MNILITGAKGFIGKNLVCTLENIRDGKDKTSPLPAELCIFPCDVDTSAAQLDAWCGCADAVVHLAGVNRPQTAEEFMQGNRDFTAQLLDNLKKHKNTCPIIVSSSTQAALDNPYGQSKKAGEELLFSYAKQTGAAVTVYRFTNVFGKWCRPNYNSVVATFCHNIANGLPIQINDENVLLRLIYIDDVVSELLHALCGNPTRDGAFAVVRPVHEVTLGKLAELLYSFRDSRKTLSVPQLDDPFVKKLHATYLSYLPTDAFSYPLKMNCDDRGSFTEIIRTPERGQFSVNISKPGITKGNHWHNTKNEKFLVVSGRGVIRFRRPDSEEVFSFYVSGEKLEVVEIPTGYTHNIENLGDTDMITFMWCNECFDPSRPDTYFLEV